MDRKIISEYVERFFHLYWKENIDDAFFILNQVICLLFLRSLTDFENDKTSVNHSLFEEDNTSEKYSWEYNESLSEDDFIVNYTDNVIPFLDAQKVFSYQISSFMNLRKYGELKYAHLSYKLFLQMTELFQGLEDSLGTKNIPAYIYGAIYEELLKRYHQYKTNVEVAVPPHIARLMAELLQPNLSDTIYTPTLGSGGLLVSAYQKNIGDELSDNHGDLDVDGFRFGDVSQTKLSKDDLKKLVCDGNMRREDSLFLCLMNLYFHGMYIAQGFTMQEPLSSSYTSPLGHYSKIMLAPLLPISTKDIPHLDEELKDQVGKNQPAMYFARSMERLDDSGRLVALMPDNFLFSQDKALTNYRIHLLEHCDLEAVISLPTGVLAPFTNIKTSIIVLSNQMSTHDDVWMCELKNDGYSLNSKRLRNSEFPLPKLIDKFKERAEGQDGLMDAFLVSKDEIRKHRSAWTVSFFNDFDTFKKESLEDPHEILTTLKELEGKIRSELDDLSTLLNDGKILG